MGYSSPLFSCGAQLTFNLGGLPLRLTQLKLKNYRGFEDFTIELEPECNVLFGVNGSGKTAILEGAAIALGSWFLGFDEHKPRPIAESDVRIVELNLTGSWSYTPMYPAEVRAEGVLDDAQITWARQLNQKNGRTTYGDANQLKDIARARQDALKRGESVTLPLIAYYASSRLWSHKRLSTARLEGVPSRTLGYTDCLDAESSYKLFVEWMKQRELARLQRLAQMSVNDTDFLDAIRDESVALVISCVRICVPEVPSLYFDVSFDRLISAAPFDFHLAIEPSNQSFPIDYLSDGVRSMVAMVADIAWRIATLNPHLGAEAAQETQGVVLIDELDLHLHPDWQRRVLGDLRRAFPRVQFIVTTHSPQVLASAENRCVKMLDKSGALSAVGHVYGKDSNAVLEDVMGVPARPAEVQTQLDALFVQLDKAEQALALAPSRVDEEIASLREQLQALESLLGLDDTELVRARWMIDDLEEL